MAKDIYFALKSSLVAAEALATGFDYPSERAYSELVKAQIQPDLTYSEMNARMFFPVQAFGFYRMARNEHVNYYFSELIAGRVGHQGMFLQDDPDEPLLAVIAAYRAIRRRPF